MRSISFDNNAELQAQREDLATAKKPRMVRALPADSIHADTVIMETDGLYDYFYYDGEAKKYLNLTNNDRIAVLEARIEELETQQEPDPP